MKWQFNNNIPSGDNGPFEVIVLDSIRTVERKPDRDWESLWFTDCTHPMQNAYCWKPHITAWRKHPVRNEEATK